MEMQDCEIEDIEVGECSCVQYIRRHIGGLYHFLPYTVG